jgi:hypothetical protein
MSNPRNVTNLIRAQETKEVRVSLFGEALANKIYPNWIHFCYSILLAPKIQMIILRASPIIHTVGSKPSPIYDRRLHAPYRQHRFRSLLGPGAVQWMTAGRGIVHSKMPEQKKVRCKGFRCGWTCPLPIKCVPLATKTLTQMTCLL